MPTVIETTRVSRTKSLYYAALATATVSGLFALIFFAVLVWSYFSPYTPNLTDEPDAAMSVETPSLHPFQVLPTEQKQFLDLKTQISENPSDEQLKARLRDLDQKLRYEYFLKRKQNRRAAWFFLGSVVILLVSTKTVATLKRRVPDPGDENCRCQKETSANQVTYALLGLGLVSCFAVGIVFGLKLAGTSNVSEFLLANAQIPEEQPTIVETTETASHPEPVLDRDAFYSLFDKQWPGFRGSDGSGISRYDNIPVQWDATTGDGILWKTELALPGNSSPIVWQNRVFLTGADESQRRISCFDTETGNLLWEVEPPGTLESRSEIPGVNEDTGFAAPTAVTDGNRVYAIFANGDIAAVDFAGKIVWSKSFGIPDSAYGYSASLAIWFDRVIIQFDVGGPKDEKSKILALDSATGDVIWETPRPVRCSWPSPIVRNINDGWQILTAAEPFAVAYDPENGREIWRCKCLSGDVGPSPTAFGDIVYIANEYPQFSAIDATQTGEISVLWSGTDSLPDTCSPLATERFVYTLSAYGYLTAYSVEEQVMAWELEVGDGASYFSSPGMADGNIYCFDYSEENMNCYVVESSETEGTVIATNPMGEPVVASPAFQDGRIYIRGRNHLFCVGTR